MRKIIISSLISSLMTICLIVYAVPYWGALEAIGCIRPRIAVHKVINHDQYNIVILSKADFIEQMGFIREVYADIWQDGKKINSFCIASIDVIDDYESEIMDIAVLPDSDELRVELSYPTGFKNRSTTHVYKLSRTSKNKHMGSIAKV
jgi:hypothetical protein